MMFVAVEKFLCEMRVVNMESRKQDVVTHCPE